MSEHFETLNKIALYKYSSIPFLFNGIHTKVSVCNCHMSQSASTIVVSEMTYY